MTGKPNPGSVEAGKRGCTCPVLDNHHGRGIVGGFDGTREHPSFWVTGGCPVHDPEGKV